MSGKHYESARDAYHDLADEARSAEARARYRLAEATAAYRAADFRGARASYSKSLLSREPAIRGEGHVGMGNSLFQLGWLGLSGKKYPSDPAAIPDLDKFDAIVKEQLAMMAKEKEPEEGETRGYVKFEALVTNWIDAIRHYDSALSISTPNQIASRNRALTITYLKRLQELLQQEEQQTRQAMPQIMPGEEPGKQPGQKGRKGPKGEPGDGSDKGDKGDAGDENGEKPGGKGKDDKDKDGKGGDKNKDDVKGKGGDNPNETPEERAGRILQENADTEKGPLTPGRREFRNAEKDW